MIGPQRMGKPCPNRTGWTARSGNIDPALDRRRLFAIGSQVAGQAHGRPPPRATTCHEREHDAQRDRDRGVDRPENRRYPHAPVSKDLPTPEIRQLLKAASIVRRTTRPLLRALMPALDPDDAFTELASLPFVEPRADGLSLNQPVQNAVSLAFRHRDIHRYRTLRRAAWRTLRDELRSATEPDLWAAHRRSPLPHRKPGASGRILSVRWHTYPGRAVTSHGSSNILSCVERFAGASASLAIGNLWEARPDFFFTTRSASEPFAGLLAIARSDALPDELAFAEPVFHQWTQHLRRDPLPPSQKAIFVREALANLSGEPPLNR